MQVKEIVERVTDALVKRIEGTKDIRKKLDYMMHPEYIETSSILSPTQIDAISAMIQIGDMYPTLEPLKTFARLYATWTPSTNGKRSEDLVKVMMQVAPEQPPNVTTINTQGAPKSEESKD